MTAMGGPFKGEMTEREMMLRKKRNRCEIRLKLYVFLLLPFLKLQSNF